MDKTRVKQTFFVNIMSSTQLVQEKLGHMVQIDICRLAVNVIVDSSNISNFPVHPPWKERYM